jgi:hypothetical protein
MAKILYLGTAGSVLGAVQSGSSQRLQDDAGAEECPDRQQHEDRVFQGRTG